MGSSHANRGPIAIVLVALVLPSVVSGCGGSSDSTSEHASSQPARGFSKSAELASYGREADVAERQQASLLLEENQSARGVGDFSLQCKTLASSVVEKIEANQGRSCEAALRSEAKTVSPSLMEH